MAPAPLPPSHRPPVSPRLARIVAILALSALALPGASGAATAYRTGMTWIAMDRISGYTHVGTDSVSNPYAGDTTIDTFLPILCLHVDGRAPPPGIYFDMYNGWSRGEAKLTPAIAATVLTSQAQADYICDETFGSGWRMAEFHDGRYGGDFTLGGGWTYWVAGDIPSGQRFWAAISDQPANAWNSAGVVPPVQIPKFMPSEARVPDQYIAMLPESTPESSVDAIARNLLATYGGTLIDSMSAAQQFSFNATEAQARAISNDARVESVDEDTYGQPFVEWHQDRVDQRFLPLSALPQRFTELDPNQQIYIHCKSGIRSMKALRFLREQGFKYLKSVKGGISAWSDEIDQNVPKY